MLSQAHVGELAQISMSVKRFGRYSSHALPVLDQVQRNFGKPETNPTFHGLIEMTRAALLERLGDRDQALEALQRADHTYLVAGLANGHDLVAAIQKSWQ